MSLLDSFFSCKMQLAATMFGYLLENLQFSTDVDRFCCSAWTFVHFLWCWSVFVTFARCRLIFAKFDLGLNWARIGFGLFLGGFGLGSNWVRVGFASFSVFGTFRLHLDIL